jgi:hypothetical protein
LIQSHRNRSRTRAQSFLFSAVATIAFFVAVETAVSPQANIHTDFEPATQVGMLRVSLPSPKLPAEEIRFL